MQNYTLMKKKRRHSEMWIDLKKIIELSTISKTYEAVTGSWASTRPKQ